MKQASPYSAWIIPLLLAATAFGVEGCSKNKQPSPGSDTAQQTQGPSATLASPAAQPISFRKYGWMDFFQCNILYSENEPCDLRTFE
jgi:hypothetical protein